MNPAGSEPLALFSSPTNELSKANMRELDEKFVPRPIQSSPVQSNGVCFLDVRRNE